MFLGVVLTIILCVLFGIYHILEMREINAYERGYNDASKDSYKQGYQDALSDFGIKE